MIILCNFQILNILGTNNAKRLDILYAKHIVPFYMNNKDFQFKNKGMESTIVNLNILRCNLLEEEASEVSYICIHNNTPDTVFEPLSVKSILHKKCEIAQRKLFGQYASNTFLDRHIK